MIKLIFKISISFLLSSFLFETPLDLRAEEKPGHKTIEKVASFGFMPLYFIPNKGQVNKKALFYAKTPNYTLWLTKKGLVFDSIRKQNSDLPKPQTYSRDVSSLLFMNANLDPEIIPLEKSGPKVNYFTRSDRSKWHSEIPTSKAVLYKNIYQNIDLKVYGAENKIEYDYIVKPGGEVPDINFKYKNVERTFIDEKGNIAIKTKFGELRHSKPKAYQEVEGKRVPVEVKFRKLKEDTYTFQVGEFNKKHELTIDPFVSVYSKEFGGSGNDFPEKIAIDSKGLRIIAGSTNSLDFPTEIPFQKEISGNWDVFITKLDTENDKIVYSTFLGGTEKDFGRGVYVDRRDNIYVSGYTYSTDFPTKKAFQKKLAGESDIFVTKLSKNGKKLVYSTFLGGSETEQGGDIAVDLSSSVYVTGFTYSDDFPVKKPFQRKRIDYSEGFITRFTRNGRNLVFSSYIGGIAYDYPQKLAIRANHSVWITGSTTSPDFPTFKALQKKYSGDRDAFVSNVNSKGKLLFSTYLGGSDADLGNSIALDPKGRVYVTGSTGSNDFPVQKALQNELRGQTDLFLTIFKKKGKLLISTFFGGSGEEDGKNICVDPWGRTYINGLTSSTDLFSDLNSIKKIERSQEKIPCHVYIDAYAKMSEIYFPLADNIFLFKDIVLDIKKTIFKQAFFCIISMLEPDLTNSVYVKVDQYKITHEE